MSSGPPSDWSRADNAPSDKSCAENIASDNSLADIPTRDTSSTEIPTRAHADGARAPRVAGYSCYGAAAMTQGTFDLYWIAVDPALHGFGVGRALMEGTEEAIRAEGGRLMLIETASKPSYDNTRAFYVAWGCREVARIPGFYAVGDDKVVYARQLT